MSHHTTSEKCGIFHTYASQSDQMEKSNMKQYCNYILLNSNKNAPVSSRTQTFMRKHFLGVRTLGTMTTLQEHVDIQYSCPHNYPNVPSKLPTLGHMMAPRQTSASIRQPTFARATSLPLRPEARKSHCSGTTCLWWCVSFGRNWSESILCVLRLQPEKQSLH